MVKAQRLQTAVDVTKLQWWGAGGAEGAGIKEQGRCLISLNFTLAQPQSCEGSPPHRRLGSSDLMATAMNIYATQRTLFDDFNVHCSLTALALIAHKSKDFTDRYSELAILCSK